MYVLICYIIINLLQQIPQLLSIYFVVAGFIETRKQLVQVYIILLDDRVYFIQQLTNSFV